MGRKWFWIIGILVIIVLGIMVGFYINNKTNINKGNMYDNVMQIDDTQNNIGVSNTVEIAEQEEKTTPNTLMIYRTYYTKCNHYINEYKDIDISAVNLNKEEIQDRNRDWKIEEFSPEQIVLEKEEEDFCNEHYKLKLVDGNIIIFMIDENNNETEYERTEITSEYLTEEDILRLKEGILVYGKENLTSVLEDYE